MAALSSYLPWVRQPLIANAPMSNFAGGHLAAAVTLSRGLGMVGSLNDMSLLCENIRIAKEEIEAAGQLDTSVTLPIAVGFLCFVLQLDDALAVLKKYKPAVVWLFAAQKLEDYAVWAEQIRAVAPDTKVWIQTGSVTSALTLAKTAQPDAICLQGADAGGHGYEKSAGIISLLPEATDAFAKEGFSHIPLLASGGIADGRGVAAALTLGARGAVVGTRFLSAKETVIHPRYQAAILEARDGAEATVRSKLFDEMRGPNIWPGEYDGRSLAMQSYKDYKSGVGLEEIRSLHTEALKGEDEGYDTGLKGRAAAWAGTGVGLVNQVQPAAEIVISLREEAKAAMEKNYKQLF